MTFDVNIDKTRASLPILVDEVVTETLTILAVQTEYTLDTQGQQTGLLKTIDVYGNVFSFPNNVIKKIATCFATKVYTINGVVYVRHPAIQKWNGQEWIEKPSKLKFGTEYCTGNTYVYNNPEFMDI
jgi:hypothetical protein